jgi:hypothetical protein
VGSASRTEHDFWSSSASLPSSAWPSGPRRPGVIKGIFIEAFQGTTPLDDPAFIDAGLIQAVGIRYAAIQA